MVTLGLVQASACPCVTDNFNTIRQYVSQAQNTGCTAICFPEAFLTGYAPEKAAALFDAGGIGDLDDDGALEAFITGIVVDLDIKFIVNNDSSAKVAAVCAAETVQIPLTFFAKSTAPSVSGAISTSFIVVCMLQAMKCESPHLCRRLKEFRNVLSTKNSMELSLLPRKRALLFSCVRTGRLI